MAELFIAPEAIPIIPSPFSEIWDDLVGSNPIIPFDRQKRERKLAGAMNKLADRIAAWRRTDLPGWKLDLVAEIASRRQPRLRAGGAAFAPYSPHGARERPAIHPTRRPARINVRVRANGNKVISMRYLAVTSKRPPLALLVSASGAYTSERRKIATSQSGNGLLITWEVRH
jgi:hypothetical protein